MKSRLAAFAATSCLALNWGSVAQAQATTELEEVVVTAQKREESLQDVAIAVSAFSGEALERAQIENPQDIQFSIPNAVLVGNDRFTLRGIGNNAISSTADNGTQTFFNGATVGLTPQDEFYDVERIEVLRGPQGTLYGRNTTGGAVNIITRRPTSGFEGYIFAQAGNFESLKLQGAINLPLGDRLRQRFAGYWFERDGYTENLATGNRIDGRRQFGVRSTTEADLPWQVTGALTLQYFEEDSSRARETKRLCKADPVLGCSPNELGFDSPNTSPVILQSLLRTPIFAGIYPPGADIYAGAPNPRNLRQVAADYDPQTTGENFIGTLELTKDIGTLSFTSLTSYSEGKSRASTDWDNADLPFRFLRPITYQLGPNRQVTTDRLLTVDLFTARSRTWSQELRVSSDNEGMFNFTAGAFLFDSKGRSRFEIWHPTIELFTRGVGLPAASQRVDNDTPYSRTKAWALFGEGYLQFTDTTKLTVGVRYTDEEKAIRTRSIVLVAPTPYIVGERDWQEWTGKVALDHEMELGFTDQTLLYGSVARGYKGGGLNPGNAVDPDFEPETVTAYEVGAKNQLLGRALQANLAAFYYDYKGLQLGQRIGGNAVTANADAEIWGLEGEFLWAPSDSWLFDANLSYLSTEIGQFLTIDAANPAQSLTTRAPAVPVNLAGNELPYAPGYKVKVGGQYSLPVAGWTATLRADVTWQDGFYAREFNTPNDRIDGWALADLQLRLVRPDKRLELQAYVKNVTDEDNIVSSIIEDALIGSYRNVRLLEPRTFGASILARF
ncbi:TonB-dependent receptor [Phenylobacterium sp.]|jgi:outer membrane receptor protein involved in Fe transport|uniref:TonB-dependent receptor n=1 Tax=Phenylobacterium sp. TaxID=1871053 RepID=UPI002E2F758F|nr:TonB-dependent receptor [Phenylobacterium sp.]HEX2560266.1 TonB-dependent receptor [Phenylobacterium sp.]